MDINNLQEQLTIMLKQEIGARAELVNYTVRNRQHDYLVLHVQLRHPSLELIVKCAGREAPMAVAFNRMAAIHRLVAEHTPIPMPDVIAADVSYQKCPWRYLIRTHCAGQEWVAVRRQMTEEQLSNAYSQVGTAVAQLHSIQFPVFGELNAGGNVQEKGSYNAALRERVSRSVKSSRLYGLLVSVLEQHAYVFDDVCDASLCHEDLHGHNILFNYQRGQWRLATILDFDKAWAGHREVDLARMDLWKGMTNGQFWCAYKGIRPIEPQYEQRRPFYQLFWCLEYAQPTAEHLTDTQRVCSELGIPPIERFD